MKQLKHIIVIVFSLFVMCISPSFTGGVGKAGNHYSQIVPNQNLQYCVVNHKFSFKLNRWKIEQILSIQGYDNHDLCKIDNGNVEILTKLDIRS